MTEQMCIIFAACFIPRSRDTYIDFLQFISGWQDLPSDASQENFLRPLLKCKLLPYCLINF